MAHVLFMLFSHAAGALVLVNVAAAVAVISGTCTLQAVVMLHVITLCSRDVLNMQCVCGRVSTPGGILFAVLLEVLQLQHHLGQVLKCLVVEPWNYCADMWSRCIALRSFEPARRVVQLALPV
jgi:hypothetical protein